MRRAGEAELLQRAKQRLDRLDLYPRALDTRRVRILHTAWLFALPWFRRFDGYTVGPLWMAVLLREPLETVSEDLVVHELCHVWQMQDHPLWMPLSYLVQGYRSNRHEVEARMAVRLTQAAQSTPAGAR